MEAAAQALAESIVNATAVTHNPASTQQQRAEAVAFFEQLKHGEIHSTVFAAAVLTGTQYALEVQVSAYSLLQYLVRQRWAELAPGEQQQVTQLAYQHMRDVGHLGSQAAWALKSKAAMLLAGVVRQQGPESFGQLLPQLIAAASEGPMQAEISCLVLQFVAEDITQFEERTGDWRRSFLSALLASVDTVLPFLVKLLQDHFAAGVAAAQSGGPPDAARSHAAVVSAALGALSSFVEWAPLGRIGSGSVVEACGFFTGAPDFREAALGVLKQICSRRGVREGPEAEAYAALIDKVADALISACSAVLAPEAASLLDWEGPLEDYGRRLAGCVGTFGDAHYSALPNVQKRFMLLEKMLGFTRHPYLQLSAAALPFWVDVLRECGVLPGGLTRAAAAAPAGGATGAAVAGGGGAGAAQSPETLLPTQCCQLLVEALAEQMTHVTSRLDEGADGDVPLWADSAADYRDFSCNYRSQAKLIIRGVTRLAPAQALASTGAFLSRALSECGAAGAAAASKHVHLEAAVQLLEAIMPALMGSEGVSGGQAGAAGDAGLVDALKGMLRQLLGLRFRDPVLVTLHARGLESFSRFVAVHSDMLVPLVQASFDCLQAVPLEQNGQLPPPAKVTQQWKEEAVARTAMAKVLLNVAREAPAAFLPHLQPLVAKVQQLWDQGLLREGEKVSLYEGLMAASGSGGPELQGQLLEWLLRPVAAKWSQPAWQATVETPEAFAREYLAFEVAPNGAVTVGSRPQRWALHYEIQLFERALRHTQGALAGGADPQQQQQQQQGQGGQQHPFVPHLEWSMLAVASILRCLHGLQAPEMIRGPIAPLAQAFEMDAVERAIRSGGERDAAKKVEEDAGTIAGTNHPALRYWMRSIREGGCMVLSYAAQGVGAPLWLNQRLAAAIPQALAAHMEHMDDRHVRILMRHAVTPLVVHCPVAVRPPWLLPLFGVLLPNMQQRLQQGWDRVAAADRGGQQQQQPGAAAPADAAAQQRLSDELVAESVLRDVSRDYLTLLAKVAERGARPPSAGGGAPNAAAGGGGGGGGAPRPASPQPGGKRSAAAAAADEESVLESLWSYDPRSVGALISTAISALCWPDAAAAGKACAVCRSVVVMAETTHPELEGLVLADLLRSAVLSTVQVSHITIQVEVLALIRQVLVTWLPRSQAIRDVLLQLPHVTPQVLASFQDQLLSIGSEKEQRNLVKRLIAEAGGEEARKVLSAVSRVGGAAISNVPDPAAKAAAGGGAVRAEEEIRWDWGTAGVAI